MGKNDAAYWNWTTDDMKSNLHAYTAATKRFVHNSFCHVGCLHF